VSVHPAAMDFIHSLENNVPFNFGAFLHAETPTTLLPFVCVWGGLFVCLFLL
jgi:hypothetical protein